MEVERIDLNADVGESFGAWRIGADAELVVFGLAGSESLRAAEEAGLRTASEVFADRSYRDDGSLLPRGEPGAVIEDAVEAGDRAVRMIRDGTLVTRSGRMFPVRA